MSLNALCELYSAFVNPMKEQVENIIQGDMSPGDGHHVSPDMDPDPGQQQHGGHSDMCRDGP